VLLTFRGRHKAEACVTKKNRSRHLAVDRREKGGHSRAKKERPGIALQHQIMDRQRDAT